MTYLKKIAEQIKRRYEGGHPSGDSELDPRELYLLICQVLNRILKTEHLGTNIPYGEHIPPHALIANYTAPVTKVSDKGSYNFVTIKFNTDGFTNYWTLPSLVEDWHVDAGDPWVYQFQTVTLTIGEPTGDRYPVTVSGFTLPSGETDVTLFNFLSGVGSLDYLRFTEFSNTTPDIFLGAGISNISATTTSLSFTYDFSDAISAPSDIRDKALLSHSYLLQNGANTYSNQTLGNIEEVVGTSNSSADLGKAVLPAMPISLPKNMGVWKVYDPDKPFEAYIPINSSQYEILGGIYHSKTSSILSVKTCYEIFDNKTLYFNKAANDLPEEVAIQLLVVDPSVLGEADILPIPADKEEEVVVRVLELLGATGQPDENTNQNEKRWSKQQ